MDPFADVAEPAPAPSPAADPFADVAQPTPDDQLTDEQWRHKYIHFTPAEQAANRVGPVLQAGPAPSFGDRALGVAKGVAGLPIALLNEGIGQSAAGLSGLGAALTGSKDFVDAANSINKETSQRTSGLESGLPLGERASEIGGSILPLLNPVTAPLVPAGMAGQGYVGATNEGATRGQALGKGAIMGAVGAALPGLGRVLAPAIAPVGTALENAVSPLAGRVATGLLQGGAAGTVLGGAEAGSTALYDPELASERFNDIPSSAWLLALLSGGHGALARSPINPHAPVEPIVKPGLDLDPTARAAFEKTSDPFADVAVDQTIRPAANGEALPAEDAANLRLPEPAPAEPTQEQVAADSTPEADAAHAKTLDPLDAHDPEQLGALGRISGGEETVTDMSPILENRRKLAEMDAQRAAAEEPTQELPPVNDEHNPTEGNGEGDFRDSIGESGPQEPVKAPEPLPAASDTSHLAPDAQESYAKLPPEVQSHPVVQETVASRKTANDAIGDKGNVEQAAEFARASIVRAKRKAEKATAQPAAEPATPEPKPNPAAEIAPEEPATPTRLSQLQKALASAKRDMATADAMPPGEGRSRMMDYARKRVKAHGFEIAAERRSQVQGDSLDVRDSEGGLTGKELQEERRKAGAFEGGRKVVVGGKPGVVTSDPVSFGRHRVKLDNGETVSVKHADLLAENPARTSRVGFKADPEVHAPEIPVRENPSPKETPKLAPGDRVNSDPEHSMKSVDPIARDAEKVMARDRVKPETQAQEPLRQEAAKRVESEGPDAVGKRLVEKHAKGEAWTQDEDNEAQKTLEHYAKTAGTGAKTRELYEAMNAQNTAKGRAFSNLRDRVQTPVQRHAEANGIASTASASKAKVLQNLLQERAQEQARQTRATPAGPSEAPAAKSLKSANAQAKAKLDAELPGLLEDFKKALRAPGANLLAGRQAEALYNLLENRVKAGVHSFTDLVRGLKKDVPDVASNKDIQESVEQGWERLRQDNPDMGKGGRVGPELQAQEYEKRGKAASARVAALDKKIEVIRSGIEKDAEELQKYLGKRGYDLKDPNAEWLKDPNRFGDFMAHVDAFKGGIPAVISNGYIGALHASFGIPAVKAVTDIDALAGDAIVRHVEGLIRVATFRPNAVAELKAFWGAAPKAASQGFKNAVESTIKERAIGPGSDHEVYGAPSPFTVKMGLAGTILRQASALPLVRGINSGAMTYAAMTDAAAWAVRSAKGLKGDELKAHVETELANPQSDSWRHAIEHAQSLTQTTPLGVTNWISRLKHSQDTHVAVRVAARVLAPFVTIPTNVALSALRRLPVTGDLAAVSRLLDYKEGSVHLRPEKLTHETARALLRWGLYALASNYLFGNDKQGKSVVSGYAPQGHDFKGDGVFTHAPHSMTILGKTIDLNRLGIVGKALSGMKDFHDGELKEGLIEAGKEEALVRPFMDLYYANKFGESGWGAYVANHFPIPSFMGQIGRAFEDKEKLSYDPADDGLFWKAMLHTAEQRAGFNQNPTVKLGGQDVEKPSFDSSILTRIYRLATPAQLSHSDDFYKAKGKKIAAPHSHATP